jgi:5-hydroxyisourate hydrolase
MIGISTHVLDTALGQPARGIRVVLECSPDGGSWFPEGEGRTDTNGRIAQMLANDEPLEVGIYKMTFHVGEYFEGREHFYREISVQFLVSDPASHYHIPLLLSPYGYTTHRGT